jgi:iron(III) transport system ATP-binding protein
MTVQTATPALQVQELSLRYPGRSSDAVAQVSFGLQPGEIGALIGPSGCGKTSLLRAVAGLEPITQGQVLLGGVVASQPSYRLAAEQRRIGMVFQDYALFPHMDVGRNVAFGIMHWRDTERRARVAEVLELVGLLDVRRRYPHELSGGQQQRVALARALAPRPQLMLLDEPFSNLDVDLRERLAQEVRGILKAAGATALLVTHDQLEAFAIADVIGVMHQGRLQQWAQAYTLYHRPATRFVADFIGHGVFAQARVEMHREDGTAHKHVVTPVGELHDISPALLQSLPEGQVEVLLRADDIVHDDASSVQAKIVRKLFRGNEFLYTLELASGEQVMAHVPSHHDHKIGEWIGIRAEVDHVVTFQTETASFR